MDESAQAGSGKTIKCSSCGGDIPVRTFKAGNVKCPTCGAIKDLGDDLAERMRAFQSSLDASPSTEVVPVEVPPAPVTTGGGNAKVLIAVGVAVLVSILVWVLTASS